MKKGKSILLRLSFLFSLVFLFSCGESSKVNPDVIEGDGYVKTTLKYAKGFEIYHGRNMTKIVLNDLENEGKVINTYYLHNGEEKNNKSNYFSIPLGDIAISSTTHAAYLASLGLEENIKGISWAQYVQNKVLKNQIDSGITVNITGSSEVDLEKLLSTGAEAFTNYPFGMGDMSKFESVDMPLIIVSEYLEDTPLARAEWIKFFAAFYGLDEKANSVFNEIEGRYMSLQNKMKQTPTQPMVLIGSEQNGVWHMPGADSFIASMIKDAGGEYLFSDFPGKNNQQVDMEILLQRSAQVDFWGKVVNTELTLNNLSNNSGKLKEIKAIKEGHVFYCNTTASDYFGQAVMEPEVILSDLIYILHPESLPNYSPRYFIGIK